MTRVSVRTHAHLCGYPSPHGQVTVILRYDTDHPYTTRMEISDSTEYVEWSYARDLLDDALSAPPHCPVGDGDVCVWTGDGPDPVVYVRLSGEGDRCTLALPWDDVARYVQRAYRVVPRGQESRHLDVDRAIRALLGGVA